MRYEFWLIAVLFVTVALNLVHWRFRGIGQFLYYPTSGILLTGNIAILLLLLGAALLFLVDITPAWPFQFLLFGHSGVTQIYSVWGRHQQGREGRSAPPEALS